MRVRHRNRIRLLSRGRGPTPGLETCSGPAPLVHCRAEGFSLLEVLLAVTLMGIAFVTLFQGFSAGLGLAARADSRSWAVIHARSVMDDVLSQDPLEEGRDSGRIDDTYSYRTSVVRVEPGEDEQAVTFEVVVQVSWGSTGYVELNARKTANEALQD